MNDKENKKNFAVCIFVLILGFFMLISGIFGMLKEAGYKEELGVHDYSETYTIQEKNENNLENDNEDLFMLLIGLFIIIPMSFILFADKLITIDNLSPEEKAKKEGIITGLLVISTFLIFFLAMLATVNFNFRDLFKEFFAYPIIILGFVALGVFCIIDAYRPKERSVSIKHDTYQYDPEYVKKTILRICAIMFIGIGIFWSVLVAVDFYLPYFFDSNSATLVLNGSTMSRDEYYSNPIPFIIMLLGFIPIIIGVVMLKKLKKDD